MVTVYRQRAGLDVESMLFEKIKESLGRIRGGESSAERVLLVVPAQYTLAAEEAAFEKLGTQGLMDLQIVSGNKLREDILKETGRSGRTPINSIGRSMVLRRVASKAAPSTLPPPWFQNTTAVCAAG